MDQNIKLYMLMSYDISRTVSLGNNQVSDDIFIQGFHCTFLF